VLVFGTDTLQRFATRPTVGYAPAWLPAEASGEEVIAFLGQPLYPRFVIIPDAPAKRLLDLFGERYAIHIF
jgi:hypothetical protein